MGNDERNPNLQQDLPELRIYRLTAHGREAREHPNGRVSCGILRLLAVLDGNHNLQSIQARLTYLTNQDLFIRREELTRTQLNERI